MRYWIVLLLTLTFAAGCVSASTPYASSYVPSENQEERIQKLLVGVWEGYVKDNGWARIDYSDRTLRIYRIRKEQNGWTANASLNGKLPEYINLYIYSDTVVLEMMDYDGGFYNLKSYQTTHLLGKVYYGYRTGIGHDVFFKKISR